MDGGLGLLFGGFAGIMLTLAAQWFKRNVWLRWPWKKKDSLWESWEWWMEPKRRKK